MNCNDIVCHGCKLSKECHIQAARLSLDILDLMYDLSTTGKGFPSDVKLAIWKITWHSRQYRFTLQQNKHVAYFLLEVIID